MDGLKQIPSSMVGLTHFAIHVAHLVLSFHCRPMKSIWHNKLDQCKKQLYSCYDISELFIILLENN